MKILIAVPTFETIYPDTFKAIWDLDKGEHEVYFDFVRGYDCAAARNNIASLALEKGVDYVLMIDNDVTLPRDGLLNLLSHNEDVVLGYYAHRDSDNIYRGRTCLCKILAPDGTEYFNYPTESQYSADELHNMASNGINLIKVHGGGMGCALIKTEVFTRLEYPWYSWINYQDRGVLSEDLYFCEQCKANGIPVCADTRVSCGHMLRHLQII